MKTLVLFLALLCTSVWGQEVMTPARFKEIVASPGDTVPLRPELSVMPLWSKSKTSLILTYQDGKSLDEEYLATAKTVGGKYIVISFDSKLYKQPVHMVSGFDEKMKTIRNWGLLAEKLVVATELTDPEKKISASSAELGDGYIELAVNSFSDKELTHRASVYKDGVLFMTRVGKTQPVPESEATPELPATEETGK